MPARSPTPSTSPSPCPTSPMGRSDANLLPLYKRNSQTSPDSSDAEIIHLNDLNDSELHARFPIKSPDPFHTATATPDATIDHSTAPKPRAIADLSREDQKNFFVLTFLYLLQGIPVGLAFGSVPFLLKSSLSYTQVGVFSLASYPYSLKLLWSPIVDAIYSPKFGRRKSWIVPIQFVSGFVLLFLGRNAESLFSAPEANLSIITAAFFVLVLLCATQDIAVDGWCLTLLSRNALSFASTAQTVGINTGYFLSFTVFLAFNSPEFANKYFRSSPQPQGLVSLSQYLTAAGWVYLIATVAVALSVRERDNSGAEPTPREGVSSVYRTMFQVVKLSNVQTLIAIHLVSKLAFQANESVTNLKLLEKGFSKEDLALTVLIDFPFEIIFGFYVAKWSSGTNPLKPWLYAFGGRLLSAVLAQILVYCFPSGGITPTYFVMVIVQHLFGSFMSTIQFVSLSAFHTQIADPTIGGTYMTTLNTISNLGGTWPKYFVFVLVDYFTKAVCEPGPETPPGSELLVDANARFSCITEEAKAQCAVIGGSCTSHRDGYYATNMLCICIGLVLFFGFIKPKVTQIQNMPHRLWKVNHK